MNDRRAAAEGPLERARVLIRIAMQSKEPAERANAALRAVEHIAKYDLLADAQGSAPGPQPFVTPAGINADAVIVGSFVGGMLREIREIFAPTPRGPRWPGVTPPQAPRRRKPRKKGA